MAWSQCMTTIPRGLLNVTLIEPPCTERYARWCERSANQLMISLLLDLIPKYTVEAVGGRFSCILQMQIREKNMPFYEEWIRESELQIKVFDCTQRAVIGWKGKEK